MTMKDDAREFGLHIKQGGWRLGLLVARNVQPGKGAGERSDLQPRRGHDEVAKVSASAFAEASGTTADRVLRYLRAWSKAAEAGHVAPAAELRPDTEPDLEVEKLPDWGQFYAAPNRHIDRDPDRKRRLEAEAEADGIGPGKVKEVAANGKALAAAIKADERTAEAARAALAEHDRRQEEERRRAEEERRKQRSGQDEEIHSLEEIAAGLIRALAEVAHPGLSDLGRTLEYVTSQRDLLDDRYQQGVARAAREASVRLDVWADRVLGLAGHTVGEAERQAG